MVAKVKVVENAFYAVTGKDGRFRIDGVPSGTWTLVAWQPYGAEQRTPVTVAPGAPVSVDVELVEGSKPKWHLAHAQAARSPAYRALAASANDGSCERCHAPLAAALPKGDPVRDEGVTCDVCHTITEARADPAGGAFAMALHDNVKYGPLCRAKDHYFHKMGCSPLQEQALLCAACHLYERRTDGGVLPVYTEYAEWAQSEHGQPGGMQCQDCHMPYRRDAEVAVGAGSRARVHFHGFLGREGELRKKALKMKLVVRPDRSKVRVDAVLTNVGAGHSVPTGLPGRQVVLKVEHLDEQGGPVSSQTRAYGRVLVDGAGREVPYFAAVRLEKDDRLVPDVPRRESFVFDAPGAGRIRASLTWRELSPELAEKAGLPSVREELLAEAVVPFAAPPKRRGARTVEVPE